MPFPSKGIALAVNVCQIRSAIIRRHLMPTVQIMILLIIVSLSHSTASCISLLIRCKSFSLLTIHSRISSFSLFIPHPKQPITDSITFTLYPSRHSRSSKQGAFLIFGNAMSISIISFFSLSPSVRWGLLAVRASLCAPLRSFW